jgi:hypothetical protein
MLASARSAPAQHEDPIGDPRRPLTSCAHRLRKPHRAFGPLTPSVARRLPKRGLRSSLRNQTPHALSCDTARGGFRHARPDRIAVCLRRRPRSDQSAFHRLDPDLAARADMTTLAFYTRTALSHTRSPATIHIHPVKDGVVASGYLALPWIGLATGPGESNEKDASHRLLQPTYDTSTLRNGRFSSAPPSSLAALRSALARRRPKPPAVPRVERRLTATLQLRRCHDLPARPTTAGARGGAGEKGHRSFLAGAAIDGPSERCLPAAVFSTARRARDVASDTLCRAPPPRGRNLAAPECQTRFDRPLVKGDDLHGSGCLPSTSAPSTPLSRGFTRSPPPFSRLCRREPASGARSPHARTSRDSSADEARPDALELQAKRRSSTSATKQSASTTAGSSEPRSAPSGVASRLRASPASRSSPMPLIR